MSKTPLSQNFYFGYPKSYAWSSKTFGSIQQFTIMDLVLFFKKVGLFKLPKVDSAVSAVM
jgi:hypothetical protein